ncbi:MAG: hypothetical protein GQ570_01820 [Helicobacteraceae bacterium]|nr:hypothetical protein [Helicobacteraceae bacterium]
MQTKDRILNALKHSLGSQVLSVSNQIILIPLFLYFWGIEKYGIWLTIIAFAQWFSLVDFGIGHYLPNRLTVLKNRNKLKEYNLVFGTFISVNIILSLFFVCVGIIFSFVISKYEIINISNIITNYELIITLILFIIYNIFQSITSFSPIVYISSNKYYMPSLRTNQNLLINLIFIPLGLYIDFSFIGTIFIMLASTILIELISIRDVIKNYQFANLKLLTLRFRIIKNYYTDGIWFMGAKLYDINYQGIPIILIQYFISPSAVVLFTIHRTVANIVMQLRKFTTNVIWRESTILYANKNIDMIKNMYLFIQKSSLYFTLTISLFVLIYGADIFALWLHENNLFDMNLLILMLIVVLVQSLWMNAETFLFSWNNVKYVVSAKIIYIIFLLLGTIPILYFYKNLYYFVIINIVLNIIILNYFIVNKLHEEISINNKLYFIRIILPFLLFSSLATIIFIFFNNQYIVQIILIFCILVLLSLDIKRTENFFINILILKFKK